MLKTLFFLLEQRPCRGLFISPLFFLSPAGFFRAEDIRMVLANALVAVLTAKSKLALRPAILKMERQKQIHELAK